MAASIVDTQHKQPELAIPFHLLPQGIMLVKI
jgi:hypothetical protein